MNHSPKFDYIKSLYPNFWSIIRLRNAVVKGLITAEEFEEITGEKF